MTAGRRTLVHAAAVVDAAGMHAVPGALLFEGNDVIAAGTPAVIGEVNDAQVVEAMTSVVLPALVNTHCHLDLSHIGPVPYHGDFRPWIDFVRERRVDTTEALADAVRRGVELALSGGTALIGDIAGAGSRIPLEVLRASSLGGVSFLEVFGQGTAGEPQAVEMLRRAIKEVALDSGGIRLGLQPHSPYSCGSAVFRAAAAMERPLATHLAETREELRFVDTGDGPLADLIRDLGKWDDTIRGHACHPVDLLAEPLSAAPWVVAHLNYVDDAHITKLAQWPVSVAYCPRASAYFGHTGHRYRDMLEAGVDVTLGTDSLLCLDTPDRISVLDEMRLLARRDGTDASTLLTMGTTAGARALGYDERLVTFQPGRVAAVIAVEVGTLEGNPFDAILRSDSSPRYIVEP
jgi:cytosine/adenosine deaminase-related metal-dependent hydrolase